MKDLPKLPKPNKYGTVSRAALAKLIRAGLLEAKRNFHYTDDFAGDASCNFGRTGWLPARFLENKTDYLTGRVSNDFREGFMNFDESDFSTKYVTGGARIEEGGWRFSVHSNLSYSLRLKNQEGQK